MSSGKHCDGSTTIVGVKLSESSPVVYRYGSRVISMKVWSHELRSFATQVGYKHDPSISRFVSTLAVSITE